MEKRYEYWGMVDGEPRLMYTDWFPWDSPNYKPKYQLEKSKKLLNEYRQ